MSAPLLIHIGYHKTATTWAQRRLFTPEHGYAQVAFHEAVSEHVVRPLEPRFDPAALRGVIDAGVAGLPPGRVPVISSEILSGHPFLGAREREVYAARLKAIAPNARILITIRAQGKILPSVYMQYVLRGGTMPWEAFFEGTREPGYFGFTPEHFEYDLLVGLYQRLFGAQNVYLMTQESLRDDLDGAASALAAFAGATDFTGLTEAARSATGVSYPEAAAPLLRRINHVQTSTLNPRPIVSLGTTPRGLFRVAGALMRRPPLKGWLAGRKPVSDYVAQRFAGHYAASNARLAAMSAHPLELRGYEGV